MIKKLGIKLVINFLTNTFSAKNLFHVPLRFKGAWTKSRTIKGRNAAVQFLVRTSILYRVLYAYWRYPFLKNKDGARKIFELRNEQGSFVFPFDEITAFFLGT